MKKRLLPLVVLLTLFIGTFQQARASHAMGADISYTNVGRDSFIVTLNFYRDCAGTTAPVSADITIQSANCGITQNITLPLSPFIEPQHIPNGSEVSALCGSSITNSTCRGGTLPGVEQYQYSALVVFPAECTDWVIAYDLCCRNSAITNLSNPGNDDLYVQATLNNTIFPQDNSPYFTNRPVPYFCFLDSILYNHGTVDIDGDSLVYSLITPLIGPGTPASYNGTFTATNPMSVNGTFSFDPVTGQLRFVPSQAQQAVVTILVKEYRNGVLIGTTMRDIQVNVLGSPICNPPYGQIRYTGIDPSTVRGGTYTGPFNLQVCPGDTLSFSVGFGGDSIYLSSNAAQAIPGATFTVTQYGVDSVRGTFTWVPTALDTGLTNFSLQFGIASCPIDRTSSQTVTIDVLHRTYAGPDVNYCTHGAPVQLHAVGGTQFTWSPSTGLSAPNVQDPYASPTVTTDYIVVSNLTGSCGNRDTVRVNVVPNFILGISPTNDTLNLCRNGLVQLNVTTDTIHGPYTYSWSPPDSLSSTTIPNPLARPINTTQYIVTVTSDTGCVLTDTVLLNVVGQGPKVVINTASTRVCPGDTFTLNASVYPLSCGPSIGGGSCGPGNTPAPHTLGTGATTNAGNTPFHGASAATRYQVLYHAADLRAAGLTSGTIVKLAFNVATKTSTGVYTNFTIRLGCTNDNQLTRTFWQNVGTQVYFSSSLLVNQGSNSFNLSQPYDWDGYSNLVMEICYGGGAAPGGNDQLTSTAVTYPASMYAFSSTASSGCTLPATSIATTQPIAYIPNTTFYICGALPRTYTYQWDPTTNLTAPNSPVTNGTTLDSITYTLNVSDSLCTGADFVHLTVDTTPFIVSNDTALCTADSVHLMVDIGNAGPPPSCGVNGNTCGGTIGYKTVGAGTTANTNFTYPAAFGGFWGSASQQFLYSASDLTASGVVPGRIKEMAFYVTNIPILATTQYKNFTIKVKCTNTTDLSVATPETGLATILNPVTVNVTATGWKNFVLDNAFDWDGSSNLVFEICFNNLPNITTIGNCLTRMTATTYESSTYRVSDFDEMCSGTNVADDQNGAYQHPNIRFNMCKVPSAFSVTWTPGNTLTDSTSLTPVAFPTTTTTYRVTLVTPSGCVKHDSVRVSIGTLPHTLTHDTAGCVGSTIRLLATGGGTYAWSPATGLSCTNCANPLVTIDSTRTYYLTITDTMIGCSVYDSVKVTARQSPLPPFGNDTAVCGYDSVTLNAGAGYTSYAWSVPNSGPVLVVHQPGTYSVTVTSQSGCSVTDTIHVNFRSEPPVALPNDTAVCQGTSLHLDADAIYAHYQWSTGDTVGLITVGTSGTYQVTVTDSNGCLSADTINVQFNPVPVVNLGNDTLLCNIDTLRLSANNGPNFTYLWSTGSTDSVITVNANNGGQIYVTVSGGGAACTTSDTINVTFRAPLQVNIGNDTVICYGNTVTFDAGSSYITYQWNTVPPSNNSSVTVGATGAYAVTVTDNIGCRGVDSALLVVLHPAFDLGPDTSACVGDTLVLSAVGNFTSYQWSTSITDTFDTVSVTTSGTYSATVTDQTGCSVADTIVVTFSNPPSVNLGADTTICPGSSLVLTSIFQQGNTYLWSDSSTGTSLAVDTAGVYFVDVTNSSGCTARDSIVVSNFAPFNVDLGPDVTVCAGDSATFDAGNDFASFVWSTTSTNQSITVATPGDYSVTTTDNNGCHTSDTVKLINSNVVVNLGADRNICAGSTTTLDAGSGYSQYNWNTTPPATTQTITVSDSGTYIVSVTDNNGCHSSDTIHIGISQPPTISLGADDTICNGASVVLSVGSFSTYLWSDSTTDSTLTATATGDYAVTVTDGAGCSATDTVHVEVAPALAINVAPITICPGTDDTLFGPSGYAHYQWSNGDTTQNATINEPGSYSLVVTNDLGCTASDTVAVANGGFAITPSVDPTQINAGQTAVLSAGTTTQGNYTYMWTPGSSLNDSTARNPTANPAETTTYYVTVTDTTTHCSVTDSVSLTVFNSALFSFPEAFTPNHDGHNDFFGIIASGNVQLTEFKIYDRWGQLLHSAPIPWNGQVGGVDQPSGTYIFTADIDVTDASGTHSVHYNGAFTLLR